MRGDERHQSLRRLLEARKIPFVNLGLVEPEKPYPSIGVDNFEAGRSVARYVTGLGHRKVALVSAQQRNNDRAQARQAGILDILGSLGCVPPLKWHLQVNEARDAARSLLHSDDQPTAVLCGNDVIAYGVMLEAIRMGVPVPQQLSVAGFDDLEWSRHLHPTLTTIHMPTDEIFVRAERYLVDVLAGRKPLMHQKVEFSLVVRESTSSPPKM